MAPLIASFGRNGPPVQRLGLGLMGLSTAYGTKKPDHERLEFLDAAYEEGSRYWDTADLYGDSEDLLKQWFQANPEKRKGIFLSTKFAARLRFNDGKMEIYHDSTPQYVKIACDKSLKRLGLPNVDLYYCHRLDQKTPIELTIQAMVELKEQGKIKYIGLSECSSESLRRAHKLHPITAVQIEYSPFALDIESDQIGLLKTCRELGVAVVAYSPLGRGMLTGNLRSPDDLEENDFRRHAPRFSAKNFPKNLQLVNRLQEIATRRGVTISQLTLAWLLAQGDDIFPIPGTTKVDRLLENMYSTMINLTEEEKQSIRSACDEAEVAGSRYPEHVMATCFADTPVLETGP